MKRPVLEVLVMPVYIVMAVYEGWSYRQWRREIRALRRDVNRMLNDVPKPPSGIDWPDMEPDVQRPRTLPQGGMGIGKH